VKAQVSWKLSRSLEEAWARKSKAAVDEATASECAAAAEVAEKHGDRKKAELERRRAVANCRRAREAEERITDQFREMSDFQSHLKPLVESGAVTSHARREHLQPVLDTLTKSWGEDTLAAACASVLCLAPDVRTQWSCITIGFLEQLIEKRSGELNVEQLETAKSAFAAACTMRDEVVVKLGAAREAVQVAEDKVKQAEVARCKAESDMQRRRKNCCERQATGQQHLQRLERTVDILSALVSVLSVATDATETMLDSDIEGGLALDCTTNPLRELADEVTTLLMSRTFRPMSYQTPPRPKPSQHRDERVQQSATCGVGVSPVSLEAHQTAAVSTTKVTPPKEAPSGRLGFSGILEHRSESTAVVGMTKLAEASGEATRSRSETLAAKLARLIALYRGMSYDAPLDEATAVALQRCIAVMDEKLNEAESKSAFARRLALARQQFHLHFMPAICDAPPACKSFLGTSSTPALCDDAVPSDDSASEGQAWRAPLWAPPPQRLCLASEAQLAQALRSIASEVSPETYALGVVVGGTGCGKTQLLAELRSREGSASEPAADLVFEPGVALVSHPGFARVPGGAVDILPCVGLNDVPVWFRPYGCCSNGQQARACLGLSLRSGATIDDFVATMDERSAQSTAAAVGKFVRRSGFTRVILATHRSSIVPFLRPDWVVVLGDDPQLIWNKEVKEQKIDVEIIPSGLQRFFPGPGGGWAGSRDHGSMEPSRERLGSQGRDSNVICMDASTRSARVLSSTVHIDDAVQASAAAFDFDFKGKSSFEVFPIDEMDLPSQWCLGAIIGPSGTGKSTLLQDGSFGQILEPIQDMSKTPLEVLSHAPAYLQGVGLKRDCWARPIEQLSGGERHQVLVAHAAALLSKEPVGQGDGQRPHGLCIDEFTSHLDRNVAQQVSVGLKRLLEGVSGRMVVAGLHPDVLEWLAPDWVYHTHERKLVVFRANSRQHALPALRPAAMLPSTDTQLDVKSLLRSPCLRFEVRRLERELQSMVWQRSFAVHHYLRGDLQRNAYCFIVREISTDALVAFHATVPQPGAVKRAYREHRLVVLPEFQGLGLGPRISDLVAEHYLKHGCVFYAVTAHPRLGQHRCRPGSLWRPTSHNLKPCVANRGMGFKQIKDEFDDETPSRILYRHVFAGQDPNLLEALLASSSGPANGANVAPGSGKGRASDEEVAIDPSTFVWVPEAVAARRASASPIVIDLTEEESQRMSFFGSSSDPRIAALAADHPDALAEPKNLVSIRSPDLAGEVLCVPAGIARTVLSSCQLETVLHAARRFRSLLPTGEAAGYYLGDGTGCGKGRQIAALVWHLWNQGARRHLWVSASWDLIADARRDLQDVCGQAAPKVLSLKSAKDWDKTLDEQLKDSHGVLFTTYDTLTIRRGSGRGRKRLHSQEDIGISAEFLQVGTSSSSLSSIGTSQLAADACMAGETCSTTQSRLTQIVEWLGGDSARGLICLDEAHKAKHLVGVAGKQSSSLTGRCVEQLQSLCPKARVLYATATAAAELRNMAYMSRLGLWGRGTPFRDFAEFHKILGNEGLAGMEMINMDMKALGLYTARSLSWHETRFETTVMPLSPVHREIYDAAADFFHWLAEKLEDLAEMECRKSRVGMLRGLAQRFFKTLLIALKVPATIEEARTALTNDKNVVISLWGTGEAQISAAMKEVEAQGDGDDAEHESTVLTEECLCTPRLMLDAFLKHEFGTAPGLPGIGLMTFVRERSELLEAAQRKVRELRLPGNPLDELISALGGPEHVAELSGRSKRLQQNEAGHLEYVQRGGGSANRINEQERRAFQEGTKRIAIITEAASAGISLHADRREIETDGSSGRRRAPRQRVMLILELPWSAEKAVQQLGRVHRSNQLSAPNFKVLVTDVGGERRFVAAISHRMKQLGAITKGDRRAALGDSDAGDLGRFDIFTRQGVEALAALYERAEERHSSGIYCNSTSGDDSDEEGNSYETIIDGLQRMKLGYFNGRKVKVDQAALRDFLNRLLALPVETQNALFAELLRLFEIKSWEAEVRGDMDGGVFSYNKRRGDWQVQISEARRDVLHTDPRTGAQTSAVFLHLDYGCCWEQARELYGSLDDSDPLEGFYQEGFHDIGRHGMNWDAHHFVLIMAAPVQSSGGAAGSRRKWEYWAFYPHVGCAERTRVSLRENGHRFRKCDSKQIARIEKGWRKQYEASADLCIHRQRGQNCKARGSCLHGLRCLEACIVSGNLLSIYGNLQRAIFAPSRRSRADEGIAAATSNAFRITKAITSQGDRVVGVEVYHEQVEDVRYTLRNVSSDSQRPEATDEELVEVLVQHIGAQPGSLAGSWRPVHKLLAERGLVQQGGASHRRTQDVLDRMLKEGLAVRGADGKLRPREHPVEAGVSEDEAC